MAGSEDTRQRIEADGMTFWEHLSELRMVLWRMIAVVTALLLLFFFAMPYIFDAVVLAPCHGDFCTYRLLGKVPFVSIVGADSNIQLINVELSSQLFTHLSTAFWMALIVAFPALMYQLWTFVAPGLYEKELKATRRAFVFGMLLFYVGLAVGYFILFPFSLQFLYTYAVSTEIHNSITLGSYMENFLMLIFMMGVVFELPLVLTLLSKLGIVNHTMLCRYRRHAIVLLLILSAIITPSDVFSMILVFIPLYMLYELTIFTIKR